ncbi:MAG: alpha/beta hydrolase [Gemmatimonadales bacterium]|jgi:pimeloyl-ACP methyl ester carboxylesterase
MPSLSVEDGKLKLHYRDVGAGGDALVLLHGFPFTSKLWDPQLRELATRYRVIAPDLRGFGDTGLPGPYSLDRLADDTAELLSSLGLERVVLGGLSMGGYVAFAFYRRHPEYVLGLILSDTKPDADSEETKENRARMAALARRAGSAAVADEMLPGLLSPTTRSEKPEIADALRIMISSAAPEAIAAALSAMANRGDSRSLLPDIDVPVLVMGGAEDSLTPAAEMRAWSAEIPTARTAFIEGAGHVANLERPDEFNDLAADFLARLFGNTR